MNNVNDFLAKLENVQWTEDTRRDKEIRGVLLGKDVRVTLDVKIDSMKGRREPFSLTMRIYIDDTLASMWGCCDLEEQMIMTEWFLKRGVEASNNEYEARQKKESEARAFFNMM
jgi:hypothetical protein